MGCCYNKEGVNYAILDTNIDKEFNKSVNFRKSIKHRDSEKFKIKIESIKSNIKHHNHLNTNTNTNESKDNKVNLTNDNYGNNGNNGNNAYSSNNHVQIQYTVRSEGDVLSRNTKTESENKYNNIIKSYINLTKLEKGNKTILTNHTQEEIIKHDEISSSLLNTHRDADDLVRSKNGFKSCVLFTPIDIKAKKQEYANNIEKRIGKLKSDCNRVEDKHVSSTNIAKYKHLFTDK